MSSERSAGCPSNRSSKRSPKHVRTVETRSIIETFVDRRRRGSGRCKRGAVPRADDTHAQCSFQAVQKGTSMFSRSAEGRKGRFRGVVSAKT